MRLGFKESLATLTRSCHAACAMFGYVAVRTVFFDDSFTAAATSYSLPARMRVSRNQQQIAGMDCKSVGGHRLDAPGADRRSNTHTVASVRTTANEASAMRLAAVPPWKVLR